MISYENLPLKKEILNELKNLSIDYVFQPIFHPDGRTVFAREALMRPADMTVTDLIEKYTGLGKLHILEIATFFGAMKEYLHRGYSEQVTINSFPSETLTSEEAKAFEDRYGDPSSVGIVEILEYPIKGKGTGPDQNEDTIIQSMPVAIDDFGSGCNDMSVVDAYNPKLVKLNRDLISGIDHLPDKQKNVRKLVDEFHTRGIKVVAEGVEEKEEFDFLKELGIDLYQGFYLARPA